MYTYLLITYPTRKDITFYWLQISIHCNSDILWSCCCSFRQETIVFTIKHQHSVVASGHSMYGDVSCRSMSVVSGCIGKYLSLCCIPWVKDHQKSKSLRVYGKCANDIYYSRRVIVDQSCLDVKCTYRNYQLQKSV